MSTFLMLRGYKEEIEADPMASAALKNSTCSYTLISKENVHRVFVFKGLYSFSC